MYILSTRIAYAYCIHITLSTCLTLLVEYGLVCFRRFPSRTFVSSPTFPLHNRVLHVTSPTLHSGSGALFGNDFLAKPPRLF